MAAPRRLMSLPAPPREIMQMYAGNPKESYIYSQGGLGRGFIVEKRFNDLVSMLSMHFAA